MSVKIGLGLATFPFSGADGFWRWVDRCESSDVDSIWQSDRLISAEPMLETMSVMAALAGRTKRLKFGMNVASLGLRDPVLIAKQCATIDVLSNGRLLPAFGVGSAIGPDYKATGTPTKGRGKRTDEGLEIISRLWSGETLTFSGDYYRLEEAQIAPRPVQDPIPLWVGGVAEAAVRRTARWGTGWQAGLETPEEIAPVIEAIREASRKEGRPVPEDHYGAGFAFRFGDGNDPATARTLDVLRTRLKKDPGALVAVGGAEEILSNIEAYKAVGVSKFILRPIAHGDDDVAAQTERLIAEVLPRVHGQKEAAAAE